MKTERIAVCALSVSGECMDFDEGSGLCARTNRCPYTGRFIPIQYAIVAPENGYEAIRFEPRD